MHQLSGLDASFLYGETPTTPMHVGGLQIYDPSTAPGGEVTFDRILGYIAVAPPPRADLPGEAPGGAHEPRPPVLGGRRGLRPRVPRPRAGTAPAGHLGAAVHPDRPADEPSARPLAAAVGDLRRARDRRRQGRARRLVRPGEQGAPCRHRRCVGHGDDGHAQQARSERRTRPARRAVGRRAGAAADRADQPRRPQRHHPADAPCPRRRADGAGGGEGRPGHPATTDDGAAPTRSCPPVPLQRPDRRPPGVRRGPLPLRHLQDDPPGGARLHRQRRRARHRRWCAAPLPRRPRRAARRLAHRHGADLHPHAGPAGDAGQPGRDDAREPRDRRGPAGRPPQRRSTRARRTPRR